MEADVTVFETKNGRKQKKKKGRLPSQCNMCMGRTCYNVYQGTMDGSLHTGCGNSLRTKSLKGTSGRMGIKESIHTAWPSWPSRHSRSRNQQNRPHPFQVGMGEETRTHQANFISKQGKQLHSIKISKTHLKDSDSSLNLYLFRPDDTMTCASSFRRTIQSQRTIVLFTCCFDTKMNMISRRYSRYQGDGPN